MNDLLKTIDWGSIDYSQVLSEDRGDDERNMDFLSRPRAGVQFVPVIEADEIVDGCASPPRPATIKTVLTAYQELVAIHGPENVITICPFKEKPAGVRELNNAIRASLGFDSPVPRPGDFLMIMKNSGDALNGERYRAVAVAADRKMITGRLIGTSHEIILDFTPHDKGPSKNVDWGYAATVHKFQGSEAAATIVVIPSGTLKLMKAVGGEKEPSFCDRSFVYTACSRPKLSLVLIGDPKDICGAIKMNRSDRVTALSRMFKKDAA
ncbi:MAG TPA: ATP-dependent RecD-like DNA helicase [Chthoniobacterales bacterium]